MCWAVQGVFPRADILCVVVYGCLNKWLCQKAHLNLSPLCEKFKMSHSCTHTTGLQSQVQMILLLLCLCLSYRILAGKKCVLYKDFYIFRIAQTAKQGAAPVNCSGSMHQRQLGVHNVEKCNAAFAERKLSWFVKLHSIRTKARKWHHVMLNMTGALQIESEMGEHVQLHFRTYNSQPLPQKISLPKILDLKMPLMKGLTCSVFNFPLRVVSFLLLKTIRPNTRLD